MLFGVLYGAWALALTIGSALSFLPNLFSLFFGLNERSAHFDSYFVMSGVAAAAVLPLLFVEEKSNSGDSNASSGSKPALGRESQEELPRQSGAFSFGAVSRSSIAQFSLIYAFTGFGLGVLVQLLPTWFTLRYGASEISVGFWIAVSTSLKSPRSYKRR